jgi:arsenate reductase-like glutaredoxin family protein
MAKNRNLPKIYQKKCDICEKVLTSLSEQQLHYNFIMHRESCYSKLKKSLKKSLKKDDNLIETNKNVTR